MLSIYHSTSPCKNQVMINNLGKLSERKKNIQLSNPKRRTDVIEMIIELLRITFTM